MPHTNNKRPASSSNGPNAMSKGVAFRKSAKKARVDDEAGSSARPAAASSPNQNGKGRQQQQQPKTQRPSNAKGPGHQPLKSALKKPSGPAAAARPPQKQVQLQQQRQTTSKPATKSKPAPKAAKAATASTPRQAAGTSTSASASASTAATTTWIQPPAPQSSFRIITGSYERLLYGLQVTQSKTSSFSSSSGSSNLSLTFTPIFQFPAHPSAIKCLAASSSSTTSKYLVTAGQDELVKIWDLRRKKEVGSLSGAESHGSPINMEFPLSSHFLLTATNVILLYRTRDWALLHTFKGHTGRVNFVATHPSAKLALSGGQDGVLRAWDLTRGKALGGTKMGMGNGGEMESLSWFGGEGKGTFFALRGRTVVRIFRKDMSEVARIGTGTLTGTRLNDVACWDLGSHKTTQDGQTAAEWKGKTLIFVAREDKKVGVYLFDRKVFDDLDAKAERRAAEREAKEDDDEEEEEDDMDAEEAEEEEQRTLEEIAWLDGHTNRVKAVSLQPLSSPQDPDKWTLTATTISSDGIVRVLDLGPLVSSSSSLPEALADGSSVLTIRPCAEHSTKGARLTCLSVVGGDGSLPSKTEDDEAEEDGDEGEDAFAGFSSGEDDEDDAEESDDEEIADSLDPEEKELKKLEGILREARRQGIDLDELMRVGVPDEVDIEENDDDEGSDDDEEEEEEEEETEGEDEA